MNRKQAERFIHGEMACDGLLPASTVFQAVRLIYPDDAADRIIAYMGNGVSLESAVAAETRDQ